MFCVVLWHSCVCMRVHVCVCVCVCLFFVAYAVSLVLLVCTLFYFRPRSPLVFHPLLLGLAENLKCLSEKTKIESFPYKRRNVLNGDALPTARI